MIESKDVNRINEKGISLFSLMAELRELMELREELMPPDEAVAINNQIKAYIAANLRKVDNVRAFWRYAEDMAAAAKRDMEDAEARHRSWEKKLDFVKSLCVEVMTGFNEKKLEGQHGYIRLQANGGNVALDIYSAALIPEELVGYEGQMSAACMALLPPEVTARQDFQFNRVPKQGAIRAAMEQDCQACKGAGKFGFGDPNQGIDPLACILCGATGKRIVPGARLAPRGVHARIR